MVVVTSNVELEGSIEVLPGYISLDGDSEELTSGDVVVSIDELELGGIELLSTDDSLVEAATEELKSVVVVVVIA